jgi:TIR domain
LAEGQIRRAAYIPAPVKSIMRQPSVFISYSWDSADHKRWVASFAARLEQNGVKVWLDQWHVKAGDSLTKFMESKIRSSGHVVVVCTPAYARKSNARQGGVGFEQQIISAHRLANIPRRKILPVLREGDHKLGNSCAIPTHLGAIYAVDARSKRLSYKTLEELLRAIFNTPATRPRISTAPLLRLPTMKQDGWSLSSGVKSNRKHPKTFYIPTEKQRTGLKVSDLAKLVFDIQDRYEGKIYGERMWVEVTGKVGPYYVGVLRNAPLTPHKQLEWGGPVVFLPEHVVDIVPAARRASPRKRKR